MSSQSASPSNDGMVSGSPSTVSFTFGYTRYCIRYILTSAYAGTTTGAYYSGIKHSPIQYSEVFPSTSNNLQENLSTVYYKQKSTCWYYSANPYIWGLNLLAHLLQTERTPTEYHGTDFCLALLESIYMHVGAWHCIKLSYPLVKSKFYTYLEQCKWLETAHWLWAPMLQ